MRKNRMPLGLALAFALAFPASLFVALPALAQTPSTHNQGNQGNQVTQGTKPPKSPRPRQTPR